MVSAFYNKESEGAVRFDDGVVNIKWPLPVSLVSNKDLNIPLLDVDFKGVKI